MPPYWYWRNIVSSRDVEESTTDRFDLPEQGAVSGLHITLQARNAVDLDNAVDLPYPTEEFSQIRLVGNGNFELVNAQARMIEAMNFWETGNMSRKLLWTLRGIDLSEEIYIPFGRYLGDPMYGLKLENFASGVQFESTNTYDTTSWTDDYTKITVDALMRKNPEGNLFSGGFLRKRVVKDKTAATETQFGVKLPTDNKLKQIYIFSQPAYSSHLLATTPFAEVSRLWLSIKSREEYIWNNQIFGSIAYYMHQLYDRVAHTEGLTGDQSATHYCDTKIAERQGTAVAMYNTTAGFIVEDAATNLERIAKMLTKDTSGTGAGRQMYWNAWGIAPHGMVPILMQDPASDDSQWMDAAVNKDVYVEATEGVSTGHWYIVLDELEKQYPS